MYPTIILDFDSTIVQCETLDELARIALSGTPGQERVLKEIEDITIRGMAGTLSIEESLQQRMALLTATRSHLGDLISVLNEHISPSFLSNKRFITENNQRIFIISSGFTECIQPIAETLGIRSAHVFANSLLYNSKGLITGIDPKNSLSRTGGKVTALRSIAPQRPIHVIGDGYTDYEMKEHGAADEFFAFTETINREKVTSLPGIQVINSFDEYLTLTAQQN